MVAKPLANRGCYKLSVLRLSLAFQDRPAPVIGQLYCSYIAVGYTELDNKFQFEKYMLIVPESSVNLVDIQ